jgi:hypothetical protein
MEFAADMLKETGPNTAGQLLQTCNVVAATQMLDVIVDYGTDALKQMIVEKPLAYLTLLNTLCNMSNAAVQADQHRIDVQEAQSHAAASVPQQPPLIHQSINPLLCSAADSSPIKPNQGKEDNVEPWGAPNSDLIASSVAPTIQSSNNPFTHESHNASSPAPRLPADSSPVKPNQGAEDNLGPYAAARPELIASAVGRGA